MRLRQAGETLILAALWPTFRILEAWAAWVDRLERDDPYETD